MFSYFRLVFLFIIVVSFSNCQSNRGQVSDLKHEEASPIKIDREDYADRLYGFWLGQCIANWTGLITEMDKIGNIGEIKTGDFYTREDWGRPDKANIWSEGKPSELSPTIEFVFRDSSELWGADDDNDIEYMYQHLLLTNKTSVLSPEEIKSGWLKHIISEEENYLWVSNQKAFDLMKDGMLPPETSDPKHNEHYEMIDAQLTTEIFGLLAPARPDIARKMAILPIQTTARQEAEEIALFYVKMHALAPLYLETEDLARALQSMAFEARKDLTNSAYPAKMYDFVKELFESGIKWEEARDSIYQKYQVRQEDGYDMTSRNLYCNACFAGGINYAASLISLFYGGGDLKETIKIGTLAGWDSDNPTATWGGLIGFMIGKKGVEEAFGRRFSDKFNIHRTRRNFPNEGIDDFRSMAEKGVQIIDRVVEEEIRGQIDSLNNFWIIPL